MCASNDRMSIKNFTPKTAHLCTGDTRVQLRSEGVGGSRENSKSEIDCRTISRDDIVRVQLQGFFPVSFGIGKIKV